MKTGLMNSSDALVLKRARNGFSVMLLKHENQLLRGINGELLFFPKQITLWKLITLLYVVVG